MLIALVAAASHAADPPQPVPLVGEPVTGRPLALTSVALAPRPLLLDLAAGELRDRIGAALGASGYPDRPGDLSLSAELAAATCKGAVARGCEVALQWDLTGPDGGLLWTGLTRGSSWAEPGADNEALQTSLDRAISSLLASPSFAGVVARSPARTWRADAGSITVRRCDAPAEDPLAAIVRVEGPGGTGSGALVSPDGFVATAAGLVGGAERVDAWTRDGTPLSARTIRVDPDGRVAILRVDGSAHPCLAAGPWPAPGERVRALGVPLHAAAQGAAGGGSSGAPGSAPTGDPSTVESGPAATESSPTSEAGSPAPRTPAGIPTAAATTAGPPTTGTPTAGSPTTGAPSPSAASGAPGTSAGATTATPPPAGAGSGGDPEPPVATVGAALGPVTEADPAKLRASPETWAGFAGGALVDGSGRWVGVLGDQLDGVPADAFQATTLLQLGSSTAPLDGAPVALARVPEPPFQARPDPSWLVRRPTAGTIRGHFVLGAAAALATSGLVIVQTERTYQQWKVEGATVNEWRTLQLGNTGGWLLGGLGVALGARAATIREPDPVAADPAEMTP